MRKIIFLLFTILAAWQVKAADKVRFVAEAADVVVSGDQVRLVFTVNSQDIKDFRAPSIKGFDVLMGPSRSQQSSIQIINGKRTSNSSTAFTYIPLGRKSRYVYHSGSQCRGKWRESLFQCHFHQGASAGPELGK